MSMRLLTAITCLLFAMNCHAWWNEEWGQRKPIAFNTTATGANTQTPVSDVPVLVRLHSGNFPNFLTVRDNGADFRFIAGDDLTPLKYHVERFDPVSELAFVWVKVPTVNAQSDQDKIYLYFGNQAAPRAEDAGGTFDVNTVAAFHFNESAGLPVDSTAYATSFVSGQTFPNPASLIGAGATLSGTEPLVMAEVPQLAINPETGWTFETWIRLNGLPTESAYLLNQATEDSQLSLVLDGGTLRATYNDVEVSSFTPMVAAQWHHVALAISAGEMQLYLDGKQVGGAAVEAAPMAGPVIVGGSADGEGLLAADIDEMRFSNVMRSADWVAFSAEVQGANGDRVLSYALDEASGESGEKQIGNFGIIFQNVFGKPEAIVEQLVIVLCGLMMLASFVIMFVKSVELSKAKKVSQDFLKAFGSVGNDSDDMRALQVAKKQFGDSPLWRVFRIGFDEINRRVSPSVGAQAAGLDAKSMSVVRASMDAAMVRESQKLNSKLVLLTIAISGGPFIGLLGTVVGVMVTFAAIAATGDVNIATIAPGMAAALLATVAGLGVAIPSLFGYNWLSSQAKEVGADMQVFADELEARFNEAYGA